MDGVRPVGVEAPARAAAEHLAQQVPAALRVVAVHAPVADRLLVGRHPPADRSILACWGVKGGKAGRPFQITVDPGGPDEHDVDALADAEPVAAGEVIRIRTTGGGGWGDPLERDPALVVRDVVWHKVSPAAALADYGVVLTGSVDDDSLGYDEAATARERASREPADVFFDRGPGYARLSGGAVAADVDRV